MIIDILKEAILSNLGPLKSAPKNWYKRHCMLCHTQGHGTDTRNRFGIQFNPQSIALNCFNCKFSAGYTEGKELSKSFLFFLNQLHIDQKFIDQIKFEIYKQKNKIAVARDGENEENKENKLRTLFDKWKSVPLPPDSLTIDEWLGHELSDPNFLDVVEYGLSRKISNVGELYWSPDTKFNMNMRLIIPYYYRNKIVGYTSRISFDPTDKNVPKYHQQCPEDFVYNLDNQTNWMRKYAIVTEGVLDAITVDGISTLGEISQGQIDIINRLQKEVIVCPDGDISGRNLVDAAIANNWAVSFPKWKLSCKDATAAAEKYGQLLTTQSIISSAVKGRENVYLNWEFSQRDRNKIKKYE